MECDLKARNNSHQHFWQAFYCQIRGVSGPRQVVRLLSVISMGRSTSRLHTVRKHDLDSRKSNLQKLLGFTQCGNYKVQLLPFSNENSVKSTFLLINHNVD